MGRTVRFREDNLPTIDFPCSMLIHLLWQNWVTLALILLLIHFATLATTNMLIATFTKILLKTFLFKMMSGHEDKISAGWTCVSIIFGMFVQKICKHFFWYANLHHIYLFTGRCIYQYMYTSRKPMNVLLEPLPAFEFGKCKKCFGQSKTMSTCQA